MHYKLPIRVSLKKIKKITIMEILISLKEDFVCRKI